eukprot:TRINITY_DN17954_c0_g1_i1.p1 TRINITY_DN17954_c0_g1~~TRINITY_DN17954_c0_g1_i1.p1  ORF type:complete len:329 (-),score=66.20 TRINITY_DN17954_c0_g1_i1:138-1124(-)
MAAAPAAVGAPAAGDAPAPQDQEEAKAAAWAKHVQADCSKLVSTAKNITYDIKVHNKLGDMMGLTTTIIHESGLLLVAKVDDGPIKKWGSWPSLPEELVVRPFYRILALNLERHPPKVLKANLKREGMVHLTMEIPKVFSLHIKKNKPSDTLGLKVKATSVGLVITGIGEGLVRSWQSGSEVNKTFVKVGDIISGVDGERRSAADVMEALQNFESKLTLVSLIMHSWTAPDYTELWSVQTELQQLLLFPSKLLHRVVFFLVLKLYPFVRSPKPRSPRHLLVPKLLQWKMAEDARSGRASGGASADVSTHFVTDGALNWCCGLALHTLA